MSALHEHQTAVAEFVETARKLSTDEWHRSPGGDKWSASQIAEHIRLAYEIFATELAGGAGLRIRTSWWIRTYIRLRYLPKLLRTGVFPRERVKAPREVRPSQGPFDQLAVLDGIRDAAGRFEAKLHPRAVVTHQLFGRLSAAQALRFATIHTRHHREQMQSTQLSLRPQAAPHLPSSSAARD